MPFGPNAITLGYGQNPNTPTGISAQVLQVNPAQSPANTVITGGSIDNTPIGQTTPSAGAFTTLTATTPIGVASGGTGVSTTPANGNVLIGNGVNYTLANLTAGSGIGITNGAGTITIANTGAAGTVTSVALSGGTTGLTVSGSPITTSGTITIGGTLAIANGGTGATTDTGARSNLGLGTMATQSAASVAITGGTVTGTTISKVTITEPATAATLTIANGKTFTANDTVTVGTGGLVLGNSGGLTAAASKVLTVSNSLTLAGTDGSTLNVNTGGTLGTAAFTAASAYEVPLTFSTGLTRTTNTVTVNTTQNIAKLSGLTTNGFVKTSGADGTLGVDTSTYLTSAVTTLAGTANQITASASSGAVTLSLPAALTLPGTINKLTLTAPATAATLTIADGKTLTANNSLTLSGTDASTLNIGTGGTLGTAAYTAATAYSPVAGSASIVTTGALNSGSITSGFGSIDVGTDAISGGTITASTMFSGPHNGTVGATTPAAGNFTTLVSNSTTNFSATGTSATFTGSDPDQGIIITSTATAGRSYKMAASGSASGNIPGAGLYFYDLTGTGIVMAFDSAKKVNIYNGLAVTGTLSATVSGVDAILGTFTGAGTGISLKNTTDTSGTQFIAFNKSTGTTIGSVSRVTTTDAVIYNTTSDARLKENFRDFRDSGRLIDALRPRVFDWKSDTNGDGKNVIGFIAQEEHAADPIFAHIGAVSVGDDDPTTITKQWQRSDSALVPILVAELKSVRARLAALEAKFNSISTT